ncbi:DnaJ domain-containing protein [Pseudorhodoferax soli]|uniref:DnaJ-class molecular chaperone n=1 Tax=Pseudorhodoferax soli TaxID=545864 RepID=A0A368Y5L2_9BURK|nr:DnaJ domain-containing protein [Pseudorhodoferax soli]RCW75492.1 DnaJ-class molecular chaperone [Pseudorhodoferax soli]
MGNDQAFAELGLPNDASESEIKAAWRRLASRWHPDRNASAQAVARMQRINQAFESIQRARQGQADAPEPPPPPPPPPAPAAGAEPPTEPPAQAARPDQPPIRRKLKLTLEEAAAGCIKALRGKFTPVCHHCAGQGHRTLANACKRCRGKGTFVRPSAWFGWPGQPEECGDCAGTGIAREDCGPCGATGSLPVQNYEVQARIPPGVRDGDLLHVAARRAPADLEVQVGVAPHPLFTLHDDGSLSCKVPVDAFAWMANRPVSIPTLDGVQPLALQRDRRHYALPGLGFPVRHRGPRAEQRVEIEPVFPDRFGSDQDILLDQLIASNAGADPRLAEWQRTLRARDRKRPPG